MDDFGHLDFPREIIEPIRDSELHQNTRHALITNPRGCWYLDRLGGS